MNTIVLLMIQKKQFIDDSEEAIRYIEFYEHDSFIDDSEEAINEYVCPECEQTIFNSDSDAEYFLLGETENGN